jgi:hypothetical protein
VNANPYPEAEAWRNPCLRNTHILFNLDYLILAVRSVFSGQRLPHAIVTVNPDLFSDTVVPVCGFLIYNKLANVSVWSGVGGADYHYTNDTIFQKQ